jgi:hypothetical protein
MRALMTMLILLQLASVARADGVTRGRRKQDAGAALIVVGSVLIVGGAVLAIVGINRGSAQGDATNDALLGGGVGMLCVGIGGLGAGIPLYISGTNDLDRARAAPTTASLAEVRF